MNGPRRYVPDTPGSSCVIHASQTIVGRCGCSVCGPFFVPGGTGNEDDLRTMSCLIPPWYLTCSPEQLATPSVELISSSGLTEKANPS